MNKIGFFNNLSETFNKERGREPIEEELKEFKEMVEDIARQCWEIIVKYIPEDPHLLIQANNPEVKAWIERIRENKAKG